MPISMATTAQMIDPNLEQFSIESIQGMQNHQAPQLPQTRTMQSHASPVSRNQSQNPAQSNSTTSKLIQNGNRRGTPNPPHPTQPLESAPNSASDRSLPTRNVSDATIDDAYVQFIFYCNPNISAQNDTTKLRRDFRAPPRGDGKSFSPWVLYELISKFERKEGIMTWTQLVLQLGVEPPDPLKGQSTQKVQQYAVRLKVSPSFYDTYLITSTFYVASVNLLLNMPISPRSIWLCRFSIHKIRCNTRCHVRRMLSVSP